MQNMVSKVSWGAPLISVLVMLTYVVGFIIAYLKGDQEMLHMLTIVAATNATAVVSYWVGSSAGSARKDQQVMAAIQANSNPTELQPRVAVDTHAPDKAPPAAPASP